MVKIHAVTNSTSLDLNLQQQTDMQFQFKDVAEQMFCKVGVGQVSEKYQNF